LRVLKRERVPEEEIALQTDLRYQEVPVKILDTVTKRTRNSEVRICKVQWSRHRVEEATWECEDALKKEFAHLFRSQPNLEDEIHFKWGRFIMLAFLSYLNCVTNTSLKNFLNLFRRLSSRSPPPDFLPYQHRAVSSSFSAELPVPLPFPLAPLPVTSPSCRDRPRAPAWPQSSAPRACPIFSFLIFCSNPFYFSLKTFFPDSFFCAGFLFLFLPYAACCLLPTRAVAHSWRARAGQRMTRRCPRCWPCTRARITPPASRHGRRGRCHSLCRCVPACHESVPKHYCSL
jgi:hypothetical protein